MRLRVLAGLSLAAAACQRPAPPARPAEAAAATAPRTCPTAATFPNEPHSCIPSELRGNLLIDDAARGFRVFEACPGYLGGEIVIEHMGTQILTAQEVYALVQTHRPALAHVTGIDPGEIVGVGFTGLFVGVSLREEKPLDAVGWLLPAFADTGAACFGIQVMTIGEMVPN